MAVEIKTSGVKPVRNSFAHLRARFGDKPATRYQEIAYDTQPEANFHYRPLWDPSRELYDKQTTAIEMQDWYALKDPRQFYYGSYTTLRAKQQDAIDRQMAFVEQRGLLDELSDEAKQSLIYVFVTLRHYEWGANTNNNYIAAYGWSTILTQAASMAMADRLGMAQHLSRIGLLLDGKTGASLEQAKKFWLEDVAWQGVRKQVEALFVVKDWFELFVAQNLVADALIYALIFQRYDALFARRHGPTAASLTDYCSNWHSETNRWVDSVIKICVAESEHNQKTVSQWVAKWVNLLVTDLRSLLELIFAEQAERELGEVIQNFNVRLQKLGVDQIQLETANQTVTESIRCAS